MAPFPDLGSSLNVRSMCVDWPDGQHRRMVVSANETDGSALSIDTVKELKKLTAAF